MYKHQNQDFKTSDRTYTLDFEDNKQKYEKKFIIITVSSNIFSTHTKNTKVSLFKITQQTLDQDYMNNSPKLVPFASGSSNKMAMW